MELQIFNMEQGTPEWFAVRRAIPTMSEAQTLLAKGRGGGASLTRAKYLRTLAGEILTDTQPEPYSNAAMERGHVMEAEARDLYAMIRDVEAERIGFMRRGRVGCSPDSLVGSDGMLEIKTKQPDLQIALLESGEVPSEHVAQLQGQLWVSSRQWVDFMSYWPGLPPFLKRVHRDEPYIATLKVACDEFLAELDALVERIRNYRSAA